MPAPEQILDGLSRIANDGIVVAALWHLVFAAALVGVASGWRPTNRRAGMLLALPLATVSAFAWNAHNPFNGVAFALLAVTLTGEAAVFGNPSAVCAGARWSRCVGVATIAFGWFYPHFLGDRPLAAYAFAAPLGLIPCPTLSAVIGCALCGDALRNRAWSSTLACVAAFYALFGVLRLGVWIDVVLLVCAVALLVLVVHPEAGSLPSAASEG